MDFKKYIVEQLNKHPSMESQDIVKLCYQATFGAEHMLTDLDKAAKYFYKEFESVESADISLYECISDDICRINMAGWKYYGFEPEWLFNMFIESAGPAEADNERFLKNLDLANDVIGSGTTSINPQEHRLFIYSYLDNGILPLHHSQKYRDREKPAYRLVKRDFLKVLPVLSKIKDIEPKGQSMVIAIDGPAGSGKTTLADLLAKVLLAGQIHMDHFFLPMELRTEKRLGEPGGNIHYERFISAVLFNLGEETGFQYPIFDCSTMSINGSQSVPKGSYRVIEGSYSHHPLFGEYADLRIFVDVEKDVQRDRILLRNGLDLWKRFKNTWIPMEDKYFDVFFIREKAQIIIEMK